MVLGKIAQALSVLLVMQSSGIQSREEVPELSRCPLLYNLFAV